MSGQDRETVDAFVAQHDAKYPIMAKANSGAYSTGGVPQAYLIGGDGNVLWQGHPGDLKSDEIESQLKELEKDARVSTKAFMIAQQLPAIPGAMKGVDRLLEKDKFGDALKKVEAALPKLEGEEQAAGEQVRDWIAKNGERGMDEGAKYLREDQIYKAFLAYALVEARFKGHEFGKAAKEAGAALKKDKAHATEIKASEQLEAIKKEIASQRDAEDKLKCLKPLLSKKYEETLAGKEAAKMAAELEAKFPQK